MLSVPTALTIAGSDSSGGAGIQADLNTFHDHGVFGFSVVTAVTAQSTLGVMGVHAVPAKHVALQMRAVLQDLPVGAIKIGMLVDRSVAGAVARLLEPLGSGIPVVLDPVLMATDGTELLSSGAISVLLGELLPQITLLTPNLPELEMLASHRGLEKADFIGWCRSLGVSLLLKGGHAEGSMVVDRLFLSPGNVLETRNERVPGRNTHGTGCTLSSAIAARLSLGRDLDDSVLGAIAYVNRLIRRSAGIALGRGGGPLVHFHPDDTISSLDEPISHGQPSSIHKRPA